MSGRPLRFLGAIAAGWIGWRTIALWPHPAVIVPQMPSMTSDFPGLPTFLAADHRVGGPERTPAMIAPAGPARTMVHSPPREPVARAAPPTRPLPMPGRRAPDPERVALALAGLISVGPGQPTGAAQTESPPGLPVAAYTPNRWSGSAWLVLRGGDAAPAGLTGGQLGGGQGGVRIAYAIGPTRGIALVSRVTSPTNGPGREAALVVEWQPTRLPLRLVVEQRTPIDHGRGGPALGMIGGTGPTPVAAGFTLESYAQGGVVQRARREPFVDGAVRLARPVGRLARATIDLGIGVSGGAQRDAARLDIGPSLGMRIPLARRSARLSLDWRQRVAGEARPGSGLALTLGGDF